MATTTKTVSAAEDKLAEVSREIQKLQQQMKQKKITVQSYRKDTRDVRFDNAITARDIGVLKKNDSRLNVVSALTAGDAVDCFRFKVTTEAETKFGTLTDASASGPQVRFQIFLRGSNVLVADNGAKAAKDHKEAYDQLEEGSRKLVPGDYVVRITRDSEKALDLNKTLNYAIQLSQGSYRNDYDTVEKAARSGDNPFGLANYRAGTGSLMSSLQSGSSFISSLPKIGTPATKKLSGIMLNALF